MMKRSIHVSVFALALLAQSLSSGNLFAQGFELPPGRILNPPGSQKSQGAAYNTLRDEYMLIFHADDVRLRRMDPDGNLFGGRPWELLSTVSTTTGEIRVELTNRSSENIAASRITW